MRSELRLLRRNLGHLYFINKNRLLQRTFVPHPRSHLFIEPASYCNLACRFCSYGKGLRARRVMATADFIDYVDQAVEMGFRAFVLTPMTGDVFMDRDLVAKLDYLERNDAVESIVFYSNFIGARPAQIAQVAAMRKLALLEISVYGHDAESFAAVAGKGAGQYRRLVANLEHLLGRVSRAEHGRRIAITISTRGGFDFPGAAPSELCRVLVALERKLGIAVTTRADFDDWGGVIGRADVADIDINLINGRRMYKSGACRLLFAYIQIMADGRVNACSCRDIQGSLVIGDLNTRRLKDIVSAENAAYMRLIDDQQRGVYQSSCRDCTMYRSIYDERPRAQPFGRGTIRLDRFGDLLGGGDDGA